MIDQLNIYGMTKLEVSIERIRSIQPRGGSWYLAFSGGKDSCVIKALADMAGVKYDAHYMISSVDPPELVRFIKEQHPDVSMDFPRYKDERLRLDPDNMDEDMVRYCMQSKGFILNPIIDWTDDEVWEFIHRYKVPYCKLYDQGKKRLGCIGCPMSGNQDKDLQDYPKIKAAYLRAFDRMLKKGKNYEWETAEDVYRWWTKTEEDT